MQSWKGKGSYLRYRNEDRKNENKARSNARAKKRVRYLQLRTERMNSLIPEAVSEFLTGAEINKFESMCVDSRTAKNSPITNLSPEGLALNKFVEYFYRKTGSDLPRGRIRQHLHVCLIQKA